MFCVDETGQHGLVCAKEDQSSGVRWDAGTLGKTRANGDGVYAGEMNTSIAISSSVALGDDGNDYAAIICNNIQVTESGVTYGDWYLPSAIELSLMYQNMSIINTTASSNWGTDFVLERYWSSKEDNDNYAFPRNFLDGDAFGQLKSNTYRVRAIRAF